MNILMGAFMGIKHFVKLYVYVMITLSIYSQCVNEKTNVVGFVKLGWACAHFE